MSSSGYSGFGSIDRRPDGSYRARWRAYPGAKQQTAHFRRRRDAVDHLKKIAGQLATGTYVDPRAGRVTFRDYAEEWRTVQPHRTLTADNVERHLRLHAYPVLGDRPMSTVRPSHVDALVRRLELELDASTVHNVYVTVASVFRAAVRDGVLGKSPCVDVKFATDSSSSSSVRIRLTPADVLKVAGAIDPRYRALVVTGAGSGLRPAELTGLEVDRVDFLRRTVEVGAERGQLLRKPAGVVGPPKTADSAGVVPVPATVTDAIAAHIAAYGTGPGGLVFTTPRRLHVASTTLAAVWRRACDAVGLEDVTPHDLRHFYASVLIGAGLSVKVVQARLRHRSAMTTLDTYAHLFDSDDDRTRAAVEDALELEDVGDVEDGNG